MYTNINICIYIYMSIHTHLNLCICTYIYICLYPYTCKYIACLIGTALLERVAMFKLRLSPELMVLLFLIFLCLCHAALSTLQAKSF